MKKTNFMNNFINVYKSKDYKKIFKTTGNLIIILLILCILKLPFIFLRDQCIDYFYQNASNKVMSNIFYYLFEILYILFFIVGLRGWLKKNFSTTQE